MGKEDSTRSLERSFLDIFKMVGDMVSFFMSKLMAQGSCFYLLYFRMRWLELNEPSTGHSNYAQRRGRHQLNG